MIKGIIFDFGNVICTFSNWTFLERLASYCRYDANELNGMIYEESDIKERYEKGLITSDEFFAHIIDLTGATIGKDDFIRIYTDIFSPIPETIDLIKALRPRYKLGLLSNTSEWDFLYGIKPVEVFEMFDGVTVSYQLKAFKPDAKLYLDIVRKLDLSTEECVYIDDIKEYAHAAEELGLSGIHYIGHEELIRGLGRIGVDVNPDKSGNYNGYNSDKVE